MATDAEIQNDTEGLFGEDVKSAYLTRLSECEKKRDAILRSYLLLSAVLIILLTGSNITIPILSIKTSELPAIVEIVTILCSVCAMFVSISAINYDAYHAIIRQFASQKAGPRVSDRELQTSADVPTDLFLKVLRSKLNIWGPDLFIAGTAFTITSSFLNILLVSFLILIPIGHFVLLYFSIDYTFGRYNTDDFTIYLYIFVVSLCNFLAVSLYVVANFPFTFYLRGGEQSIEAEPMSPRRRKHRLTAIVIVLGVILAYIVWQNV